MNPVPLAIISTFIFASILLIVTGAWNNFMFRLLKSSQIFKNEILGDLIYAILVTTLGLLILYLIIKYIDNKADIKKASAALSKSELGKMIPQIPNQELSSKNVFIKVLDE